MGSTTHPLSGSYTPYSAQNHVPRRRRGTLATSAGPWATRPSPARLTKAGPHAARMCPTSGRLSRLVNTVWAEVPRQHSHCCHARPSSALLLRPAHQARLVSDAHFVLAAAHLYGAAHCKAAQGLLWSSSAAGRPHSPDRCSTAAGHQTPTWLEGLPRRGGPLEGGAAVAEASCVGRAGGPPHAVHAGPRGRAAAARVGVRVPGGRVCTALAVSSGLALSCLHQRLSCCLSLALLRPTRAARHADAPAAQCCLYHSEA